MVLQGKGDHDNPNSLASALNMNYGQLLTCLKCVGLARPDGRVSKVIRTWTNILGIGDDNKEAPLLNIFSKNIYIRLGNTKPKEVMLPKAQGGGQHNFVEAGQQLGRKFRHLKLLISRYEDAAAKQQEEERTQQTNENTGIGTPPISSESRTGGSESSIDTSHDLNFSSESRNDMCRYL